MQDPHIRESDESVVGCNLPASSDSTNTALANQVEDLNHTVNLMVREMGRIQQALARIEGLVTQQKSHSKGNLSPSLQQDLVDTKERVFKEAISSSRERQAIQQAIKELREQIKGIEEGTLRKSRSVDKPELEQRVGIFVDVQNIFYAAKQFNARLDFEKLLRMGVGQRRLIRAIAYVVQSPEVDQSGFISMLQQKSYEVRRKDLRTRSDGSAKGDWDMGMAIDIMGLVDQLDVVVLVSGDGDFVSLVNLVKTIGPRIEVVSFQHNTARDLIQSADRHIPIEETLLMRPTFQPSAAESPDDPLQDIQP